MYAYQQVQQRENSRLRLVEPVNHRRRKVYPHAKRVIKKKKVNPLVYLIRVVFWSAMFIAFAIFVFPTCYNRLVKQVVTPSDVKMSVSNIDGMVTTKMKTYNEADLYSLMYPSVNYLHNDLFLNRLMLVPTVQKVHSEVTTMYQTEEMSGLKKQILGLMSQYPMIHPSVYVWEFDNGRYVNINANEQFSAASIIKLPVLVRMFKSIEAKQMTIYDEMTLTNYYKSSGSGELQYAQTGRKYSLDQLAKTMIQDSDNSSTNMIMSKLGGMDDINIGLREWGISKTYVRTWLPDMNGTNKTTALDLAKILYNLDNPGFLNINSREYIIDYMSHVKNNKLIAAGLGSGALFVHKTGDIGKMLGDAGIVYAPNGKKYIIVILANRPYNAPQGKDFIVKASSLIYKAIVG